MTPGTGSEEERGRRGIECPHGLRAEECDLCRSPDRFAPVWVATMGELYHISEECQRLRDADVHNAARGATLHGGVLKTLEKARSSGLEPCPGCHEASFG